MVVLIGLAMLCAVSFLIWYASTWGDRELRSVHHGMSRQEVRALMGKPRRQARFYQALRHEEFELWDYSRWWSSDAVVYFDAHGEVTMLLTD